MTRFSCWLLPLALWLSGCASQPQPPPDQLLVTARPHHHHHQGCSAVCSCGHARHHARGTRRYKPGFYHGDGAWRAPGIAVPRPERRHGKSRPGSLENKQRRALARCDSKPSEHARHQCRARVHERLAAAAAKR